MEHDMYDNDAGGGGHGGMPRARLRRPGPLAAAVASLALLAAACSSSPGTGGTGAGRAGGSAKNSALAYSRCMRSHGITSFPDPNPQGGLTLNGGQGTGINPRSPQFKAANHACRSLLPPPAAQSAADRTANLKFARCMRAHGISDFPDPNAQGALQIQAKPGGDLDPNNPQFKAANRACQHYQTGRGPGGFITSGNGVGGGGGGS
jgi:hypothetical protein